MKTRSKTSNLKPKTFHVTISAPHLLLEASSFVEAIKIPKWRQAMQNESDALL